MKRKEIHTAAIHEFLIHDRVFKSIEPDAVDFFGLSRVTCGRVFRGLREPCEVMREKLGVPEGIHIHAGLLHRYEIHNRSFESHKKAAEFFDTDVNQCGLVFRGVELPTWLMIGKLKIKHLIEVERITPARVVQRLES